MSEIYNNKHPDILDDEIDFGELFHALLKGKKIIIFVTSLISILGLILSLSLPNIYESKAVLAPVKSSNSISRSLQSYNGLAGLAGISLPSGGDDSNSEKAIVKIGSLSFFKNNVLPNIFLPDLMALNSWDSQTNTLSYDESIYKKNTNTWVRKYSLPSKQIPSAQESFKIYQDNHFTISEDKKTSFVTLAIKHQSPFIAKEWTELVINEINAFYRQKDQSETIRAINYLNKQITLNSLSEVKEVIAALLQEEMKKLALIEAKESYVFEFIDPPAAMEKKLKPQRAIICILSAFFGGILSIFMVLVRHYALNKKIKLDL